MKCFVSCRDTTQNCASHSILTQVLWTAGWLEAPPLWHDISDPLVFASHSSRRRSILSVYQATAADYFSTFLSLFSPATFTPFCSSVFQWCCQMARLLFWPPESLNALPCLKPLHYFILRHSFLIIPERERFSLIQFFAVLTIFWITE